MRDLPAGITATFLFTDVEGSTKLLHDLGPGGYTAALAEHRRVLRDAFGNSGSGLAVTHAVARPDPRRPCDR